MRSLLMPILVMCSFIECDVFAFQSIEDQVRESMAGLLPQVEKCCEQNGDIFSEDKCRYFQCMELDEVGGQPIITLEIVSLADKWLSTNMSEESKYLIKRLPKSNMLIDIQRKKGMNM